MPQRDILRLHSTQDNSEATQLSPAQVFAASGTVDIQSGDCIITLAGVATLTFPAPVATQDDFKRIRVVSTTANAHILSFGANKLNGSKTSLTWTRATAGLVVELMAYQGVWYAMSFQDAAAFAQYITLA